MRINTIEQKEERITNFQGGGHKFYCDKCKTFQPQAIDVSVKDGLPVIAMQCRGCGKIENFECVAGGWIPTSLIHTLEGLTAQMVETAASGLAQEEQAASVIEPKKARKHWLQHHKENKTKAATLKERAKGEHLVTRQAALEAKEQRHKQKEKLRLQKKRLKEMRREERRRGSFMSRTFKRRKLKAASVAKPKTLRHWFRRRQEIKDVLEEIDDF